MIWIVEYNDQIVHDEFGPPKTERVEALSLVLAWGDFRRKNPDAWINAIVRAED